MEQLKDEIAAYWRRRTAAFAALREKELQSALRARWERELLPRLPQRSGLQILDAGTGSGFLAILLAAQGHSVTGIDMVGSMCRSAEKTARSAGVQARFFVMDAQAPDFPAGRFDVIVSRNLTWNLPHLAEAYAAWRRILKPGGLLLNFDGDYCRERPLAELRDNGAHEAVGEKLRRDYERFKKKLAVGQQPRPAWDVELLRRAGFEKIAVDDALSRRIYTQADAFYNPTPMFLISAAAL